MTLDVATVVAATGAQVLEIGADGRVEAVALSPADLERPIATVSIDSRAVTPGSLFVALQGERVDGHRFVPDALRAGACACLVAAALAGPLPAASRAAGRRYLFVVPDPLPALQQLAAYWRRRHEVEVVGITGSIGKTTTKEIVASLLAARWPVLRSQANLNTEIGLPLMLLRLGPEHRLAVLEMGMYAPGDIALLAEIARPRVGLVTNVAPIHLERMRSIERIARAKSELIAALPPDGLAVLNGDDPWTRAMALTSGLAASLLVGFARDCAYRAGQVTPRGLEGVSFTLEAEGRKLPFRTQVAGVHTLHAFLMAAAVGRARGMTWEEIREAAGQIRLESRQRVLRGAERLLIIDDSYNAAPQSMGAALALLAGAPGQKIAVLGDMLELGPGEEEAHRQVGERAAEVADWLVVRGERGGWIAEAAARKGLPLDRIARASSNADAVARVRAIVGPSTGEADPTRTMQGAKPGGDEPPVAWSVLVKGSRGMRMEEVVEGLRGGT